MWDSLRKVGRSPLTALVKLRPEKDHPAQLHAFQKLLDGHPEYLMSPAHRVRLVLIGGSRNADDAARVDNLKELAKKLRIEVSVGRFKPAVTP